MHELAQVFALVASTQAVAQRQPQQVRVGVRYCLALAQDAGAFEVGKGCPQVLAASGSAGSGQLGAVVQEPGGREAGVEQDVSGSARWYLPNLRNTGKGSSSSGGNPLTEVTA